MYLLFVGRESGRSAGIRDIVGIFETTERAELAGDKELVWEGRWWAQIVAVEGGTLRLERVNYYGRGWRMPLTEFSLTMEKEEE